MPIKKDKKKSKTIVIKKTSKKGKLSQSQSITVNIQKGKSSAKQPSGKPTIASSIASLANVLQASNFYRPTDIPVVPVGPVGPVRKSVSVQAEPIRKSIAVQAEPEGFVLEPGRFNLPPPREPVSLKLPPKKQEPIYQELKTRPGPTIKKSKPIIFKEPDILSDISEPESRIVEETKPKRKYVKTGKYSKKQPKKPPVMPESEAESEESGYPIKPPRESFPVFEYISS